MTINRVLTDTDRALYEESRAKMQEYWPELYSRKIGDSLVQFAFAYDVAADYCMGYARTIASVLCAGSYEDIVGESLKMLGMNVVGVDPVLNSDLHTFTTRHVDHKFDVVVSASVLEHVENDEEFVADCCNLLVSGGFGVFTMDFKDDWKLGQPVPYTSRRFYTTEDLTERLRAVLRANGCDLVEEPDYSAKDRFVWDGINYSFATWVFKKG